MNRQIVLLQFNIYTLLGLTLILLIASFTIGATFTFIDLNTSQSSNINSFENPPHLQSEPKRYAKDQQQPQLPPHTDRNDTDNDNTAPSNTTQSLSDDTASQAQRPLLHLDKCALEATGSNESSVIKVGYLTNIHGHQNRQRQGIVISGAITYAISVVNKDRSKFNGRRIELIANDTEGQTLRGTSAILHQWRQGAIAFFGPEDSCEVEAAIASAINLPMISYKCADSKASNKHFYRTFVRTHPPDTQIVSSVISLLEKFKWRKFSIISEKSTQYQTVARHLADRARTSNFTINSESKFENIYACCVEHKSCCHDSLYNIIEDTFKRTRIYVFLGTVNDLIIMMQVMQVKNLINNGDYLVIYIDLDQYSKSQSYKYFWRSDMDPQTKKTMIEAARSLLVVVTSPPNISAYSDFEENVRYYNSLPPFNFSQPFKDLKKHITIYASYLYDAFMLYADALDDTIRLGADIHDGEAIVKRIINRRSYQSVMGSLMNIDSNGDVEGNYSVLALRPTPPDVKATFKVNFNFDLTMLPVCNFYYENNSLMLTGTIDWVKGGRPPLDEPRCAYDGSICRKPPDNFREKLAAVQLAILLTLSVIVFQVYKNWKKEKEIAGLLWRMELDDIEFHGQLTRTQSRSSFASQMSNESTGFRNKNTYIKTATYKGVIVAIKELRFSSKQGKDIPRASKVEMKLMKEIRHDNINQFIGACIKHESNSIYIVTGYCSKGSLQDVLDNPDVKLDSMFVSSLIFDLLSGLNYLHNSELKCHGNLKSSNCLITSRWVLKITDFGLHNFRQIASTPVHENLRHTHYRNQLWKAPELLRNQTMLGNQKTDIYAFGIILHEIIGRHGPFGIDSSSMKPEVMIDSIMNPQSCCTSNQRSGHQTPRQLHRQTTTSSASVHTDRTNPVQHRSTKCNHQPFQRTEISPHNHHCKSGNQHHNNNQTRGFIQLEQYDQPVSKSSNYETALNMSPGGDLGASRKVELPEDENHCGPDTPFFNGTDPKQAIQATNNNGSLAGRQIDVRLFRPHVNLLPRETPQYLVDTMRDCWSEKPENRPDLRTVRRRLECMRQGSKHNIMDNMMAMMEKYANNLEGIVEQRTAQLSEEKKKTEVLLHRMLPPSVAGQLMVGEEVRPESFDAVTIFFSDIVGFTEMSSKSTPMQVVVFLNDLYTLFDGIIQEYRVYKVETIGDAYMVASGLPERITDHANEIASMAIELLKSVEDFRIRHIPQEPLQLRIGLHTGKFYMTRPLCISEFLLFELTLILRPIYLQHQLQVLLSLEWLAQQCLDIVYLETPSIRPVGWNLMDYL